MSEHTHIYRASRQEPTVEVCLSRWGICDAKVRERQAPAVAGSNTSQDAARSIAPAAGTLRLRVLDAIRVSHGITDEEGIDLTGLAASTYRPRRVELVEDGLVVDRGRHRPTRSGRMAVVWMTRE